MRPLAFSPGRIHSQASAPARPRCLQAANRLAAAALLVAAFALFAKVGSVRAIEFSPPPGMNVPRQENLLKQKVKKIAQELVGDDLVDVVVTVGYARTEKKQPRPDPSKIKLPGFNRYITPSGTEGEVEISPEFVRLRQIFVFVAQELARDIPAIKKEIENLGGFDRKKGDWVQVIPVEKPKEKEEAEEIAEEKQSPQEKAEEKKEQRPDIEKEVVRKRKPRGPFSEPKSTAHLLRARTAYFKEDYNRALDHILRAISIEPQNSQAYAMLGSLYYTINWKNLALKYWEKSLEIDPENREVENLVAELRNTE